MAKNNKSIVQGVAETALAGLDSSALWLVRLFFGSKVIGILVLATSLGIDYLLYQSMNGGQEGLTIALSIAALPLNIALLGIIINFTVFFGILAFFTILIGVMIT